MAEETNVNTGVTSDAPTLDDLGAATSGKYVEFVTIEADGTAIVVRAQMRGDGVNPNIQGASFAIATVPSDAGQWACGLSTTGAAAANAVTAATAATTIDGAYLPSSCK